MSASITAQTTHNFKENFAAPSLGFAQRREIAIQALGGRTPISHMSDSYSVSRKFVYEQQGKALKAISQAFEEKANDDSVLFHLPVTKQWIHQFVLAQILIGRCSYDGIIEIFRDLFDYHVSKGTVHNIAYATLEKCSRINHEQDLSQIKVPALDEIYQAGEPVLVGCDTFSTFCFLLSLEDSCDANTWGVRLLELSEKQGLNPDHTIADGGPAARRGQKDAWPDVSCHGDVFHALCPLNKLVCYLDNRVTEAFKVAEELRHKIQCPRGKWKQEQNLQPLVQSLEKAEIALEKAFSLAEDVTTLYRWLKNDILSLVGPSYQDRRELLEFVIEQLSLREESCLHRIGPVRKYLENHKDNLLEFVPLMEKRLEDIAKEFEISLESVLAVYQLKGLPSSSNKHWEQHEVLRTLLGGNFYPIEAAIVEVLGAVVRASSLVENLNSRLRNCFTLRKQLGNNYLELLRFFLNHRRFNTSEKEERVGKSPTELLTGITHKHWLELLGYELFKQAA
jgi:hypothetical protein